MQVQDSTDPTGVAEVDPRPTTGARKGGPRGSTVLARNRKAAAALDLSLSGMTWENIARAMGYPTPRAARVAVERALAKELSEDTDAKDRMRAKADMQLSRLLRSLWSKAIDPDHPDHLIANSKARELIADHRKLYGLDAPSEVIVHNPTTTQIDEWVARVLNARPDQISVEEYDVIVGEVVDDHALPA